MTSANATAPAAVAPSAAALDGLPLPLDVEDSPSFATLMAETLGASVTAVPVECETETKSDETQPLRFAEPTHEEPAGALLMAGLIQPWANTALCPPAPEAGDSAPDWAHLDIATGAPVSDPACLEEHPEARRIGDRRSALHEPERGRSPPATAPHLRECWDNPDAALPTDTLRPGTGRAPVRQEALPQFETATEALPLPAGEGRGEREDVRQSAVVQIPSKLSRTWSEKAAVSGDSISTASSASLDPGEEFAPDAIPARSVVTTSSLLAASEPLPKVETTPPFARRLGSAAETKFADTEEPHAFAEEERAASPAGTGTAELSVEMKPGAKQKQFADRAQQILPPAVVAGWASAMEPMRRCGVRPAAEAGGFAEPRPDAAVQFVSLWSASQPGYAAEELNALPAAASIAAVPTELLQVGVLRHVTELRQTGATEMAVVLKPDAETQLSLRLTLSGSGEVTVQARCEQGDAQLLAANWGEIRHSLAQQGVRLGALEFVTDRGRDTFPPHASNGGPSPDGQPSSQRHGQPWPETLDDLPLVGSLTEPPARRGVQRPPARSHRRWESWA